MVGRIGLIISHECDFRRRSMEYLFYAVLVYGFLVVVADCALAMRSIRGRSPDRGGIQHQTP